MAEAYFRRLNSNKKIIEIGFELVDHQRTQHSTNVEAIWYAIAERFGKKINVLRV